MFTPGSLARRQIDGWAAEDWVVLTLGIAAIPLAMILRHLRPFAVALVIPVAVALRPDAYLPAMYVVGLLPFAALLAAGSLDWLFQPARVVAAVRGRKGRISALVRATPATLATGTAVAIGVWAVATAWGPWTANLSFNTHGPDLNAPSRSAVSWLRMRAARTDTILVDDSVWVDLVDRGFPSRNVVWFFKVDTDPAVRIPWQRFTYVVETNFMNNSLAVLPRARHIVEHSTPVVTFVNAGQTVEIRRVDIGPIKVQTTSRLGPVPGSPPAIAVR